MSDELLKKVLEYDPLDNAEHITGKSYKDDERTMAIWAVRLASRYL